MYINTQLNRHYAYTSTYIDSSPVATSGVGGRLCRCRRVWENWAGEPSRWWIEPSQHGELRKIMVKRWLSNGKERWRNDWKMVKPWQSIVKLRIIWGVYILKNQKKFQLGFSHYFCWNSSWLDPHLTHFSFARTISHEDAMCIAEAPHKLTLKRPHLQCIPIVIVFVHAGWLPDNQVKLWTIGVF